MSYWAYGALGVENGASLGRGVDVRPTVAEPAPLRLTAAGRAGAASSVLGAGPGLAASGYAAFSLAMAAGRFAGDRLTAALGPARLARFSALLACAGLVAAVAAPWPLLAAGGFALTGLGLSNLIPLLFSAAGRTPGVAPGQAIAGTASAGYLGFLIGPPIIGFTAGLTSLRVSLAGLALCAGLTAALSRLLDRPEAEGGKEASGETEAEEYS